MFKAAIVIGAFVAAVPVVAEPLAPILAAYQAALDEERPDRAEGWPDLTPATAKARTARLKALVTRLDSPAPSGEGTQDALTRDILRWRLATRIEEAGYDSDRIPFTSGDGFYTRPIYVASNIVIRDEAGAKAWIARIAALPTYYDQAIANMRRGLATGFVAPAVIVDANLVQLRAAVARPVADNPLLKPFAIRPPAITEDRWVVLKAEAAAAVAAKVKPAEASALAFIERDYRPKARATLGASSLPGGATYYPFLVRLHTTTDMTPQQVFDLGQAEIARIDREMEAAKAEVGFKGSMREFLTMLRTEKRFYATDPQDFINQASAVEKRADEQLPRYFATLPRLTFTIRLKPPELEGTSGGYFRGDPVKGIAGAVMMTRLNTQDPLFSMPAWILHEGVPGHHLQIALAQERTDLPRFRRNSDMTAFSEGWGLYVERLGEEMGMYRTPYERIGRLSWEMWRACRLIMDVGIHQKGWSFDQAAACLRERTTLPERFVVEETLRYIGWPGQALAYKVGEIKIRSMRARAEQALGPKFDIRAFHDAILDDGAMPLGVLDRQIDAWIAARQAQ